MTARLTRRVLLPLVGVSLAVSADAQTGGAATFVRDFYAQEVTRHAARERVGESDLLSVFTADAQNVWRAASANRNKANIPLGPILHVFFGQGALPAVR